MEKKGQSDPPKLIFADVSRTQVEDLLGKTYRRYFVEWHVMGSTSLELIRTFINQGLGIGVLPERVANAEGKTLEVYNPQLPSRPDEIFLTYRKEVLSSRAGKEFLRLATVSI